MVLPRDKPSKLGGTIQALLRTKTTKIVEEVVMQKVNSESAFKFSKAKREMAFGRLSRNNIIDLIDVIVRRTYIKPQLRAIFKNFFI